MEKPMIADRALYLDETGTQVLEESYEARTAGRVLAWRGGEIPDAEVQRLGLHLVDGKVMQGDAPAETPAAEPEAPAPAAPPADPPAPDSPPAGGE